MYRVSYQNKQGLTLGQHRLEYRGERSLRQVPSLTRHFLFSSIILRTTYYLPTLYRLPYYLLIEVKPSKTPPPLPSPPPPHHHQLFSSNIHFILSTDPILVSSHISHLPIHYLSHRHCPAQASSPNSPSSICNPSIDIISLEFISAYGGLNRMAPALSSTLESSHHSAVPALFIPR